MSSSQDDGAFKEQQREKLDDLSFIESIGLYWVNPADRNTEAGPSQGVDGDQAGGSTAGDEKKERSIEEPLDEFDPKVVADPLLALKGLNGVDSNLAPSSC